MKEQRRCCLCKQNKDNLIQIDEKFFICVDCEKKLQKD